MEANLSYTFVDQPSQFAEAAERLAEGLGPFCIDTERAGGYRYDDRAFLVQIYRKNAGTFLIAPEHHREEFQQHFAPVCNNQEWVIHAASEDLPCLAQLGLRPYTIFDTELAARFAGFPASNLGLLVKDICQVSLAKQHSKADWSQTPLSSSMLEYAAQDVIYLPHLEQALVHLLDSQGKLEYATQEFAHLVKMRSDPSLMEHSWLDTPYLSDDLSDLDLTLTKWLWDARDCFAYDHDIAPGLVLPTKLLVPMAKRRPTTVDELLEFNRSFESLTEFPYFWLETINDALVSPLESSLREQVRQPSPKSIWEWTKHNRTALRTQRNIITRVEEICEHLGIPKDLLLTNKVLNRTLWTAFHERLDWPMEYTRPLLARMGMREWQIDFLAPIFVAEQPCRRR